MKRLKAVQSALAAIACWMVPSFSHAQPALETLLQAKSSFCPQAFQVLADGSALVLDAGQAALVRMRPEGTVERFPLRGEGFDAARSNLVDLKLLSTHRVLVLDQAVGTLWLATTEGLIRGRAGLFVAPEEMALGPNGMISVWDPGVGSVTVFSSKLSPLAHTEGVGLSAAMASDGRLGKLTVEPNTLALQFLSPRSGRRPQTKAKFGAKLVSLGARVFADARILGFHRSAVYLEVLSAPTATDQPDRISVWRLPLSQDMAPRELVGQDLVGQKFQLSRGGQIMALLPHTSDWITIQVLEGVS